MKAIARRLSRLEQRFGMAEETWEVKTLRLRLASARLRCGLPPPSPERLAALRRMSIVEILNAGRQGAAVRARLTGKSVEDLIHGKYIATPGNSGKPEEV